MKTLGIVLEFLPTAKRLPGIRVRDARRRDLLVELLAHPFLGFPFRLLACGLRRRVELVRLLSAAPPSVSACSCRSSFPASPPSCTSVSSISSVIGFSLSMVILSFAGVRRGREFGIGLPQPVPIVHRAPPPDFVSFLHTHKNSGSHFLQAARGCFHYHSIFRRFLCSSCTISFSCFSSGRSSTV